MTLVPLPVAKPTWIGCARRTSQWHFSARRAGFVGSVGARSSLPVSDAEKVLPTLVREALRAAGRAELARVAGTAAQAPPQAHRPAAAPG